MGGFYNTTSNLVGIYDLHVNVYELSFAIGNKHTWDGNGIKWLIID